MNENEIAEDGGEDLHARIARLEADLASKDDELAKVNGKNVELVREKQSWKSKASQASAESATASESIETVRQQLADRDAQLRRLVVDNEINAAIQAGNVRDEMRDTLADALRGKVEFEEGVASIGERSVADHLKVFLATKNGSHFVRAADATGGGATGSTSKAHNLAGSTWSLQAYTQMKRENPAKAAAFATHHGHGYMNQGN